MVNGVLPLRSQAPAAGRDNLQQDSFTAEGLRAALGGAIVHDEEIGIRQEARGDGGLVMVLPCHVALTEGAGLAPGPVATVLDTLCGVTTLADLGFRESTATLDLRIDYLRPARPGLDLVCEARVTERFGTIARGSVLVAATARHPGAAEPIALATGRFFRKKLPPRPAPHNLAKDRALGDYGSYQQFMGFIPAGEGSIALPFRSGLIGNGTIPSLHGGVLAAHLQEAARGLMAGTRTPHLATAHFTFQTYGMAQDIVAQARVEKAGGAVSFVSAISHQPGKAQGIASAVFTFVAP